MKYRLALICALAAGASAPSQAASERWTQFVSTGEITGMADAGGQIWVGAFGGLIRIDKIGVETTYFNQANSSLRDLGVRNVASNGKGSVAATTRGGALAVFDGHSWSNPGIAAPLRGQACFDAVWDAAGSFWVLAIDPASHLPSVFRRRDSQWSRFYLDGVDAMAGDAYGGFYYSAYLPAGFGQPSLQTDREGQVWVSVLNRFRTKVFRIQQDGSMDTAVAPEQGEYHQLVVPDSGAPVWLGSTGMLRTKPDGLDTLRPPLASQYLTIFRNPRNRFARAADGSELWSLVPGMIHRRRSGVWDELALPGGQPINLPLLLPAGGWRGPGLTAHEAYVATDARFGTLDADSWTLASLTRPTFPAGGEFAVFPGGTPASTMLLGGRSGVHSFDWGTGIFTRRSVTPATAPRYPISVFAEKAGRVWVSSRGFLGALGQRGMDTLEPTDGAWLGTTTHGSAMNAFMAEDPAGALWFADGSRLLSNPNGSADPRTWIRHPLPAPWEKTALIAAIGRHRDGSIWIAANAFTGYTERTIAARFDGKSWIVYDSLSADAFASSGEVQDLRCDGAGNVWLRFPGSLLQWDGTAWKEHKWTSSAPLGKRIAAMAVDGSGALWAATSPPEATLLHWSDRWESVADAEGKMGSSWIRSMAFDVEGKLWMSSEQGGVLILDPAGATTAHTRPRAARGGRPARATSSDGTWRILTGDAREAGHGFPVRAFDLRGRAVPLLKGLP